MCEVYSESTPNTRLSQKMHVCEKIKSDLSQWRKTLPPQMDYIAHSGDPGYVLPQALCLLSVKPPPFQVHIANLEIEPSVTPSSFSPSDPLLQTVTAAL